MLNMILGIILCLNQWLADGLLVIFASYPSSNCLMWVTLPALLMFHYLCYELLGHCSPGNDVPYLCECVLKSSASHSNPLG